MIVSLSKQQDLTKQTCSCLSYDTYYFAGNKLTMKDKRERPPVPMMSLSGQQRRTVPGVGTVFCDYDITQDIESIVIEFAIKTFTYYEVSEYGCKGLVKTVTDSEGNTTTYTYDQNGNTKTVSDPEGNTTEYDYDSSGQLTSTLSPKGELTKNTYYDNGSLESEILAGGETTLYRYDSLGQMIQEITPNIYKETQSEDVGYRYTITIMVN